MRKYLWIFVGTLVATLSHGVAWAEMHGGGMGGGDGVKSALALAAGFGPQNAV